MNKQEAIEEVTELFGDSIQAKAFRNIIRKLHEPQKVVVPKHIAEKIEYCKDTEGYGLFHAMDYCYQYKDSADWLECNEETFARAWDYGYEIEQEKLYTVEIPNPHSGSLTVLEKFDDGTVAISQMDVFPTDWRKHIEYQLTESEIKQDFEWAWQFAVPVEEEE